MKFQEKEVYIFGYYLSNKTISVKGKVIYLLKGKIDPKKLTRGARLYRIKWSQSGYIHGKRFHVGATTSEAKNLYCRFYISKKYFNVGNHTSHMPAILYITNTYK